MLASEQLATTQSQRAQTQTQPAPTTPTTPALAPREAVQEEEAEEQVRSPSRPFPEPGASFSDRRRARRVASATRTPSRVPSSPEQRRATSLLPPSHSCVF